jgi:hypothetical protein
MIAVLTLQGGMGTESYQAGSGAVLIYETMIESLPIKTSPYSRARHSLS